MTNILLDRCLPTILVRLTGIIRISYTDDWWLLLRQPRLFNDVPDGTNTEKSHIIRTDMLYLNIKYKTEYSSYNI